jgi:hypothetical protein
MGFLRRTFKRRSFVAARVRKDFEYRVVKMQVVFKDCGEDYEKKWFFGEVDEGA